MGYAEERKRLDREAAKKVVGELSKFANNMNLPTEEFVEAIMREHRTLQQSIFGLFLKTIEAWSNLPENRYDPRNEYTVETSRKIMALLGTSSTPFL